MKTDTYILEGKNVWDRCVLQVADSPSNIKAVVGKVITAEVLMPTRSPFPPLHIVHPLLKPGLIMKGKSLIKANLLHRYMFFFLKINIIKRAANQNIRVKADSLVVFFKCRSSTVFADFNSAIPRHVSCKSSDY